jgi:hypothetical protein
MLDDSQSNHQVIALSAQLPVILSIPQRQSVAQRKGTIRPAGGVARL